MKNINHAGDCPVPKHLTLCWKAMVIEPFSALIVFTLLCYIYFIPSIAMYMWAVKASDHSGGCPVPSV